MSPTVLGRIMLALGGFIFVSVFGYHAFARDLSVFAVQRNLQLSNKEPVYHDYYLDGGSEAGLRAGQVVTVVRRIPLHDLTRNRPLGDMHLPVAQLKLIYVQRGSSVARLHKLYQDKERPIVDFNGVMVGDRVSEGGGEGAGDESAGELSGEDASEAQAEKPAEKQEKKAEAPKAKPEPAKTLPEKSVEKADASSHGEGPKPKPATPVDTAPKT
ncbi:MAG TPA: hypothetical protein VFV50_17345 [Bdellovibrionales bacterium]|nr:hypothetical protein [Bdellovibrionales bacterium]